jgi:DNA-binding NarL/FixJ family response regulator
MIYLIDDKKTRQKDFGWTPERFAQYDSYLTPLYDIDDVAFIGENLYNDGNIIIYHESFLDFTSDRHRAMEQRSKLAKKASSTNGLSVAFFSGSQSSRSLHENVAHLPVATVYQNLEILIQRCKKQSYSLKSLLFGKNPEIEENLNEIRIQANKEIEINAAVISGKNLFIRPTSKYISNAIEGAIEGKIFNEDSDEEISQMINEWITGAEYDNIFIPLCFGQTLSDFNGLRLATHLRCSPSLNQLKRIFIYSFIGIESLLDNEYFNILKTKNVDLVPYSKKAFEIAANKAFEPLLPEELPKEIQKLKLDPPLNYSDSHSIANEWAIYQWAKTIGCDETDELTKIFKNVQANLYFKYLRTINPISEHDNISPIKLKINDKLKPRVLLIDDEADKGWDEIFAYLLYDLNNIDIDYLGYNFKNISSEEIIQQSFEKVFTENIDIVILDFRLNPSDFGNKNSKQITSVKLLKKIKDRNPGVQVIAFSATSKIWNFQALLESEIDHFVFKDSSENVNQTILSLMDKIKLCSEKSFFLKPIYETFKTLKNSALGLSEAFKNNMDKNLSICMQLLVKSFQESKYRNYAYLQLFLIVEEFIKEESVFEYGSNCYVISPTYRYLVLSKTDPTRKNSPSKSALKFVEANGHYHIEHSSYNRNLDTNFIMSAILLFRYGLQTSGGEKWSKVYSIRNKKAAHPEVGIVDFSEINLLVKFLLFIINEANINPIEPTKALKELSQADQVENLKKIWGVK